MCVCVCVCVFHTQDGSKGTRQNVGQGCGRRPTWARPGQYRGRGAWIPPRLTPGRSQGLFTSTSVAWRCRVGSRVTASPFWGVWAPSSYSRGQVGGGTLARLGQGCRGSSGPHVWTWDSGPGSFLQEIVSPENQKPSEQLSMKSNVDFFLML